MSSHEYDNFTAEEKHNILSHYIPGQKGSGSVAVAKQFGIKDHSIILYWYKQWDGTPESLEKKTHSNRKRKLTEEESNKYVRDVMVKKHRQRVAVSYPEVVEAVKRGTGKEVQLRTIQRYGHDDYGFTSKQTSRKLEEEGIIPHSHLFHMYCCPTLSHIWYFVCQRHLNTSRQ
jgi:transposase-like protein